MFHFDVKQVSPDHRPARAADFNRPVRRSPTSCIQLSRPVSLFFEADRVAQTNLLSDL